MKYDKSYLRKSFLKLREKKYLSEKNFNFNLIFNLIKKNFGKKRIVIAGYYPSNHEVNILNFLKNARKKKLKILLPVIKSSEKMDFKSWEFKEPLYISKFGTLEPKNTNKNMLPDLVLVPLVAYDSNLNRIGYGKGYYDRILKRIRKIKKKTVFLGIAFTFQKHANIPINKHDFKLDYIFTESGIINSNNKI